MISLARLALDHVAAGSASAAELVAEVPAYQWGIYFEELSPLCSSGIAPNQMKQRNALRIELLPDAGPRCSRKSPDGRGLAWLLSGGDPLAYGRCCLAGCPRVEVES